MSTYKLKSTGVNAKSLHRDITEFVDNIITEFSVLWDSNVSRDAVLEVLDEFLEELAQDGKITQWNVVCDDRNNNSTLNDNGITNLEVSYRQDDCYNTTKLDYTIFEGDEDED